MNHQSGEIIHGKYRITGILGRGGVAITYSAVNLKTESSVAIKVISLKQLDNWKQIDLFAREAEVLAKLDHPAIPQYIDYFDLETDTNKAFYLVQQQAPGKSLFDLVESGWRTTEAEVKNIAEQILAILSYLHSLEPPVIHRDLKPNNLIRSDDGKIYLLDFGAVRNTYYNTLMQGSTVVGTYGYMAPEQFRGQALPATDLYSLGATLLYLLTHRSPAELPQDTLKLDFRSSVDISASFADWLDKILEPDIEDRFTNADEALAQLFASKRKKQGKLVKTFAAGILAIGLIFGVNSYKWFFLSYLGFYPDSICQLKIWNSFFKQGGKINSINIKGIKNSNNLHCALKNALEFRNISTLEVLLQHGAKLRSIDNPERFLIHSINHLDVDFSDFLLKNDIGIKSKNKKGETLLFNVARYEQIDLSEYIDLKDSDSKYISNTTNKQLLREQNSQKYIEIAKAFIKHGADVNAVAGSGRTPLFEAKDVDMAQLLIKHGADVNAVAKSGRTPLFEAKDVDMAQLLIKHGADINALDGFGRTPLFAFSNIDIVQLLIDSGADINAKDKRGITPLFFPSNQHIAKLLIDNGADIEAKAINGNTPLFGAISQHKKEVVELLIHHGANIHVKNTSKQTPLFYATAYGMDREVAELLINHGADINVQDKLKRTPIFKPIDRGQKEIVQFLITNGANLNIKDRFGHTPLSTAVVNLNSQLVQMLIDNGADTNYLKYDVIKKEHYLSYKTSKSIRKFLDNHQFQVKHDK